MAQDRSEPHQTSASRALVALDAGKAGGAAGQPVDAAFTAQLIACRDDVPAYRARRRLDPRSATSRYAEGPTAGPGLARTLRVL